MPEKIFVTGATGFLGSSLVKKLCKSKRDVTILIHKNPNHSYLRGLKVKRKKGDIRDYHTLLKAMNGCSHVYHLAPIISEDPKLKKEIFSVNVAGTENVMKACLKLNVKKVVHVSSTSVFGFSRDERTKLNENSTFDFENDSYLYGQSKKSAEDAVQHYVSEGLNATIVNPCSIVGVGDSKRSVYNLIKNIANGRIKFAFPGGACSVGVEDVIEGIILAMNKGKSGERYILAGEYMKLIDRYNLIANLLKKPKIRFEFPRIFYYPVYLLAAIMQSLFKKSPITTEMIRFAYGFRNFDTAKAQRELGWKPKVTFEESMKHDIVYYNKYLRGLRWN